VDDLIEFEFIIFTQERYVIMTHKFDIKILQ